jgi:hypothetical protein
MKSTAEKTSSTSTASRPQQGAFFPKTGETGFFAPTTVQAKLAVNNPGDAQELEADATADKVMRSAQPLPLGGQGQLPEEQLQRTAQKEEEQLQRQCKDCSEPEERDAAPVVQRQVGDGGTGGISAPPIVGEVVSSTGRSMDTGAQSFMETRFGQDFSQVRIHDDDKAAHSAESINAHAYTYGNHIVFNKNQYQPGTQAGKHLLAHELTHVLQQGGTLRRRVRDTAATPPTRQQPAATAENSASPGLAERRATTAPATPGRAAAAPAAPPATDAAALPPPDAAAPLPAVVPDPAALREPLMPPAPEQMSAASARRIAVVESNAAASATAHSNLPPETEQTASARAGVQEPVAETEALAQRNLVAALNKRPEPSPEIEELCANIRRVIYERRPPDEESLLQADPEAAANEAGSTLSADVEGDAQRVGSSYDELGGEPTGTPEQMAQPIETPPTDAGAAPLQATQAAPDAVPAEDLSLDADAERSAQQMEEAGMNSEPAQLVQTGPIAEARGVQGELEQAAREDPALVQAQQAAAVADARNNMAALQEAALNALLQSRSGSIGGASAQQTGMVGSEVQQREQVAAQAEAIFSNAQTQVQALLEPLSTNAMATWEAGKTRIAQAFRDQLDQVQRWIDERHEGVGGAIVEVWDDLTGMPDWVTEAYDRAERQFGDDICDLIREISTEVNTIIATCEQLIENADRDIAALYASLPAELAEWAAGEQARFRERLDGLRQSVVDTQQNFTRDLANQAAQTVQAMREEVHALRERARGLLGQIADAIGEFLEDPARAIINGLLSLVGIEPARFWALVDRIGQVIGQIAEDPIGFAGNLLSAIGAGFERFFNRIGTHLFGGLIDWLFSGLGAVGVQIPRDFSLGSIVTFFLQLMGITWERVRRLMAQHIGEENVAMLEQAYGLIADLIARGPEGIFEMIRDQLDPQTILDTIIQMAIEFMTQALIQQVTVRILLMFNPVGAIAQAIEAIYRVLKWIFENAARIFSLVETVVNGIADILAGNIAGMAEAVELALARLIAPVIDFLAGYAGLGDLPNRIADAVRGLQGWVEGILDRVIGWLAARARGLLEALGIGGDEAGEEAADGEIGETVNFNVNGESHRIWVDVSSGSAVVKMASNPIAVRAKLDELRPQMAQHSAPAQALFSNAENQLQSTEQLANQAQQAKSSSPVGQPNPQVAALDTQVEQSQHQLTGTMADLLEMVGQGFPPEVGLYGQLNSSADRHAHHVPAEQLAVSLRSFLDSANQKIDANTGFDNLKSNIAAKSATIGSRFPGGTNLSAILIHKDTHLGGEGVHSRSNQAGTLDDIEQQVATAQTRRIVVFVRGEERLVANLQNRHWSRFIAQAFILEQQAENASPEVSINMGQSSNGLIVNANLLADTQANPIGHLTAFKTGLETALLGDGLSDADLTALQQSISEQVLSRLENAIARTLDDALGNGLSAVRNALQGSMHDGRRDHHAPALRQLQRLATDVWSVLIL